MNLSITERVHVTSVLLGFLKICWYLYCHIAMYDYTPGMYAEGYIVFAFPSVRSYVRSFVRSYFRPVRGITSNFYVQATRVAYISPTTHQKAFIFGP